ncbi:hypothetical protein FB45DRAFT_1130068 [Roridomyces roridus]|uniref:Uncharacterized protein n=1 Tax=Roridomyces roridus TaxID=1738132 RepID=A0AAD7B339_9AGAR|nr:hypothetical protein FB45DRAFT_1130068 [Roridomyces roridus]
MTRAQFWSWVLGEDGGHGNAQLHGARGRVVIDGRVRMRIVLGCSIRGATSPEAGYSRWGRRLLTAGTVATRRRQGRSSILRKIWVCHGPTNICIEVVDDEVDEFLPDGWWDMVAMNKYLLATCARPPSPEFPTIPTMLIPQELVDIISEILLARCTYLRPSLVHPSQSLLFKRVDILPPKRSGDDPCQKLHQTITSSPHLASLVHDLRLVLAVENEEKSSAAGDLRPPWILSGETLSQMLPLLRLKHIALVDDTSTHRVIGGFNWSQLCPSLQSALIAAFSSPKLLSLFCGATSLKSLHLSHIIFDPDHKGDSWPLSRVWRPKLTSISCFEIEGDTFHSYFLNPQIDLSRSVLTTLMIMASSMNEWNFGPPAVSALENLVFYVPHSADFESLVTPRLRSLQVFTSDWSEDLLKFCRVCPRNVLLETLSLDGARTQCTVDLAALNDAVESLLSDLPSFEMVEFRVLQTHDADHQAFLDWSEQAATCNSQDFWANLGTLQIWFESRGRNINESLRRRQRDVPRAGDLQNGACYIQSKICRRRAWASEQIHTSQGAV